MKFCTCHHRYILSTLCIQILSNSFSFACRPLILGGSWNKPFSCWNFKKLYFLKKKFNRVFFTPIMFVCVHYYYLVSKIKFLTKIPSLKHIFMWARINGKVTPEWQSHPSWLYRSLSRSPRPHRGWASLTFASLALLFQFSPTHNWPGTRSADIFSLDQPPPQYFVMPTSCHFMMSCYMFLIFVFLFSYYVIN